MESVHWSLFAVLHIKLSVRLCSLQYTKLFNLSASLSAQFDAFLFWLSLSLSSHRVQTVFFLHYSHRFSLVNPLGLLFSHEAIIPSTLDFGLFSGSHNHRRAAVKMLDRSIPHKRQLALSNYGCLVQALLAVHERGSICTANHGREVGVRFFSRPFLYEGNAQTSRESRVRR